MSKITLQGHIIVPCADLESVESAVSNHIELTRAEDGCLVFEVVQDSENKNRFNVYEEFVDQNSFSSHQQRVGQSAWGKITVNVERHYQITEE
ncbi:MAG: antibiotic biosynthesis monooxygenase [Pseudomonadales bacterium]|nr:antibiotic biosynthesis monooxygenase [Pseudomonadales bacterium]